MLILCTEGKIMRKILLLIIILLITPLLFTACSEQTKQNENEIKGNTEENHNQKEQNFTGGSDAVNKEEHQSESETDVEDSELNDNDSTSRHHQNNESESVKDTYALKLKDAEKETNQMRENPKDETTFALKEVEGHLFDIWDGLLNEIYSVLKQQLSLEEMEKLRVEQREWLQYRDQTAKEASLEYEGGTMEQYEYVKVENDLTKERCFELVELYLK